MAYNVTCDITGPTTLLACGNTASDGLFSLGFLLVIMTVIFYYTQKNPEQGVDGAFILTGFVGVIVAGLMWFMDWMVFEFVAIPIPIMVLGFILRAFKK